MPELHALKDGLHNSGQDLLVRANCCRDDVNHEVADLDLNLTTKRTLKHQFLYEMNLVVPWAELFDLVSPFSYRALEQRHEVHGSDGSGDYPAGKVECSRALLVQSHVRQGPQASACGLFYRVDQRIRRDHCRCELHARDSHQLRERDLLFP